MSVEGPISHPDEPVDARATVQATPAEGETVGPCGTFVFRTCCGVVLTLLIVEGVVLGGTRLGWVGALLGPVVIYMAAVLLSLVGTFVVLALMSLGEARARFATRRKKRRRGDHPLADDEVDARNS